jgi:hypothetical protein
VESEKMGHSDEVDVVVTVRFAEVVSAGKKVFEGVEVSVGGGACPWRCP